ncbi:MAG: LpxI family protein, partial [Planctomycetota bacterium]
HELEKPLGIIAGSGRFPFLVAQGAKRAGRPVVVVALRGLADPALRQYADRFCWSGIVRLGQWIKIFRRSNVSEAIMAGAVKKSQMYGRFRLLRYLPDWTSFKLWFFEVADRRNDTILRATADRMQKEGITLTDSIQYCREHLAPPGVLTRQQPTQDQNRDIEFGWPIARQMGNLDIGQSIAVKEQEVIAVEAIEGTDHMIERAGALCPRGGWMLIKVAKPQQDQRFDVPTVGVDTIENLYANGATALIIETGKTLVIEKENMIDRANRLGIIVLAHQSDE